MTSPAVKLHRDSHTSSAVGIFGRAVVCAVCAALTFAGTFLRAWKCTRRCVTSVLYANRFAVLLSQLGMVRVGVGSSIFRLGGLAVK